MFVGEEILRQSVHNIWMEIILQVIANDVTYNALLVIKIKEN